MNGFTNLYFTNQAAFHLQRKKALPWAAGKERFFKVERKWENRGKSISKALEASLTLHEQKTKRSPVQWIGEYLREELQNLLDGQSETSLGKSLGG